MAKKELAYSELTNKVYYVDGKGGKIDMTDNFIQIMLCWINKGELPKVNETNTRKLKVGEIVHWEINAKRTAE